ncbi:MAG: cobyrinate a,c-diamide synthase [Desulfurivibrio sp.]|nr:cobyrinate a,c-diamide synthase [Desulfurivibrio sp.]
MSQPTPDGAFVLAGTHSGCGKTTVTLGLLAALGRRGIAVRPFKCGPDFIDPTLHQWVTGRRSRNLDPWMAGAAFTRQSFAGHCRPGEVGVIEGVMGMFDGDDSSAAALARLLGVPVVLVLDVRAAAASAAAVLKGFESLEPAVAPAAVILNRVGSQRHLALLRRAIEEHCRAEIIGYLPRELEFSIPHRHLGLYMGEEGPLAAEGLDKLAAAVDEYIDLSRLLELAKVGAVAGSFGAAGQLGETAEPTKPVGADPSARYSSFSADILSASEAAAASGHPCPSGGGRNPLNRADE